jgi:hypothetical protein
MAKPHKEDSSQPESKPRFRHWKPLAALTATTGLAILGLNNLGSRSSSPITSPDANLRTDQPVTELDTETSVVSVVKPAETVRTPAIPNTDEKKNISPINDNGETVTVYVQAGELPYSNIASLQGGLEGTVAAANLACDANTGALLDGVDVENPKLNERVLIKNGEVLPKRIRFVFTDNPNHPLLSYLYNGKSFIYSSQDPIENARAKMKLSMLTTIDYRTLWAESYFSDSKEGIVASLASATPGSIDEQVKRNVETVYDECLAEIGKLLPNELTKIQTAASNKTRSEIAKIFSADRSNASKLFDEIDPEIEGPLGFPTDPEEMMKLRENIQLSPMRRPLAILSKMADAAFSLPVELEESKIIAADRGR